jgi:multiple sugar transport system substrate-binding protein
MTGIKKLAVGLLCAMMLGTMASCSQGSNTTPPENSQTASEDGGKTSGTVEFWLDKMADQEIIDKVSTAWKKDSGIDLKIIAYPDAASFQTAMQQSIDDPKAPGLFTWWSGSQLETLAKNDKLVDLTSEWDDYIKEGVSPDIMEAFTVDGKVYAAPYSILYNTVLYNKTVFDKAGVTETPKTFDEFLSVLEKIKQSGVTPIGLKNDSWASFIWFQQLVAAYDPQLYVDLCSGTKPYNDPDVKKVMEIWKDMFDKGYFAKPVLPNDMFKSFAKGEVGMMLEPNTEATSMLIQYGMEPGVDIDTLAVPSMKGGKSTIFFEASPIAIPKATKDIDTAKAALRGFYKQETQKVMLDEQGIANTSSVEVENKTIVNILAMTADGENYQLLLRYYENTPEEIRNYAIDELTRFMYSGADIDEILNNIQKKADKVWASLGK